MKSRVRPAAAMISAMILSVDTSEPGPLKDDCGGPRTVKVDTAVERIVVWDMESIV